MELFFFVLFSASVPFIIYLYFISKQRPRSLEQAPAIAVNSSPNHKDLDEGQDVASHCSILVVEDQLSIRILLKEALEELPLEVREAETGEQALDSMRECPSRIVLMDVSLPDMNGLDVLHTVRTMRPDTEVIMMSAYSDADKVNEAKAAGAIGFFSKPFDLEELRAYISSRL
ncbi:response regulator [Paenibacillus alvei]|uniref:response regulator n=1 Tax=Paenibacillus alvei TaxID=44250 RepID=UPI00227FCFB6|nr:response regulator [Paenibacillus alvei]MCY9578662.1 response regulator [Paenibacillus alvei]MCY9584009.1 response regulator [Paenibacillus alvei]